MELVFKPWRTFYAMLDEKVIRGFLVATARDSERAFKEGIASPKHGRLYRRSGGRTHRASAPGEYPARDSGATERSISSRVRKREATIGTSTFYARFLAEGTSRMAPRRMSRDALEEGIETARHRLKGFATWKRA